MDNRFIRFYNQNRLLFWTIVLVIVGIIALIHLVNNQVAKKNIGGNAQINSVLTGQSEKPDENYTVITGKKLNDVETTLIKQ